MLWMLRAHGALALLGSFACGGLLACGTDQTAILLSFESSTLGVPEDLDQVRIVAMGESGVMADVTTDLARTWPQTYAIRPGAGGDSELVSIRVFGLQAGAERLRRVLPPVRFVAGTTTPVRVDLERSCLDIACSGDADCRNGTCTGEIPEMDAGVDAGDADAGDIDGGDIDGGEVDGGDIDAGDAGTPSGPRLIFTEYVEGSGAGNKALEISNLGDADAPLAGCSVRTYFNGATRDAGTVATFDLAGTIAPGATYVLCHPSLAGSPRCDAMPGGVGGVTSFNGNDAVELVCIGVTLDVIGDVGIDPGTAWTRSGVGTADQTLRRKCAVRAGRVPTEPASQGDNTTWWNPSTEWDAFELNTVCDLGRHCEEPACGVPVP